MTDRDDTESGLRRRIAELEASNARYADLYDRAPVGYLAVDGEGVIREANLAAAAMLGIEKGRLAGRPLDRWIEPGCRDAFAEYLARLRESGARQSSEMEMVRPDGTRFWVRIDSARAGEGGGEGPPAVRVVLSDITAGKRAEAALKESEGLYRSIGESIDYGVWVCAPDGRNTYASDSFLDMVGLTQEQCSSFGWGDVLHPDDAERTIREWKECVRTGGRWDIEHRFRGVDGRWHHVLARGVPVRDERGEIRCWAGINLDITERKRVEEELRRSDDRLGRVARAGRIGLYEWDVAADSLYWSPEAYELFGIAPDVPPRLETWIACIHSDDRDRVVRTMTRNRERVRPGDDPGRIEYRVVHPDGSVHWLEATTAYDREDRGVVARGAVREISDRKMAEEAIRWRTVTIEGINAVLQAALASRDEEELGTVCLEIAQSLTGSRFGFIGEIRENELQDVAISNPGWDACRVLGPDGHRVPVNSFRVHGIYGRVLRDGKGLFTNDPAGHPDRIGLPEGHPPLESFLGVPLLREGRVIGMIAVGNREGGYGRREQETLEVLAPVIVEAFIRKRAEEALKSSLSEKDVLMRELAHRTKNNMQVIASLISLQAASLADRKLVEALDDTKDRIRAMALVHENLYRSESLASLEMGGYARELVAALLRAHRGACGSVTPVLEIDDIPIPLDAAVALGLIINELTTNSLKHAFAAGTPGTITLSLRRAGDGVELRYRDDGPGLPGGIDVSRSRTLGLKIVHSIAVRQLRGKMELLGDPPAEFVFRFDGFSHMDGRL
jgi:PAS domain S-box-containing protein